MKRTILDLTGEVCPVPLLRTQEAVGLLPPDGELVVEIDLARSIRNITYWCNRQGLAYRIEGPARGIWRIRIQKVPSE